MRGKLVMLADGTVSAETMNALVRLQEAVAEQVAKSASQHLTALESADREDAVGEWLEDHGIDGGWDIAPTFVEGGVDTDWLERIAAISRRTDASASLEQAVRWINYTIESELLMNQIVGSEQTDFGIGRRRQAIFPDGPGPVRGGQCARTAAQHAGDVRRPIEQRRGKHTGAITVVKEFDQSLPEIPCYPGDLNQVWTNIIDNAIAAMRDKGGTLTVRTGREGESWPASRSATPGPASPMRSREHIFEPFFTTKPVGEGTGLGLDLAWNIVVKKHRGDFRVESVPGNTRFIVLLPLEKPPPRTPSRRPGRRMGIAAPQYEV